MGTIIPFPVEDRPASDQMLASVIGHVVLYYERIHRAMAQLYKTCSGHGGENYSKAFLTAAEEEDQSFKRLVCQAFRRWRPC
jgi:hypothetical protein